VPPKSPEMHASVPWQTRCYAAVLVCAFAATALALDPRKSITQLTHVAWGARDHIGQVNSMCQTRDGYIWVATDNGLFRFDGEKFSLWEPLPGEPDLPGIPGRLLATRDGGLWVGGAWGATLISGRHAKVFSLMVGTERARVHSLCEGPDGSIWAGTFKGLYQFTGGAWHRLGAEVGIPDEEVIAVMFDRDSTLWAATQDSTRRPEGGIAFLCQGEPRFQVSSQRFDGIPDLAQAPDGKIWAAETGRSVRAFTHDSKDIQFVRPEIRSGSESILFDRDGGLWITTEGDGLRRARNTATLGEADIARFSHKVDIFTRKHGLSSDTVTCSFEDREGAVWFGTTAGVDCFRDNKFTRLSVEEGMPFDEWLSVAATPDGSIWAAGPDEGFMELSRGQDKFVNRNWFEINKDYSRSAPVVYCIYVERSGDLVLGTGFGVATVSLKSGKASLLGEVATLKTVLAITRDAEGGLWLCDRYLGVFRLFQGKPTHFPQLDRDWDKWVYAAHTDSKGRVWIGFASGEVALREGQGFRVFNTNDGLFSGQVNTILSDRNGNVWVAGKGGFSRFGDNRFQTLDRKNGLPFDDFYAALQDDDGYFWLAGEMGVFRTAEGTLEAALSPGTNQVSGELFDLDDGLRGVVRHVPFGLRGSGYTVAARDADGKLWFATSKGLAFVDPHNLPRNRLAPPVHIQQMIAGGKAYPAGGELRLPVGIRRCEIQYAALTFGNPARVFYKYKLEGSDHDDWADARTERKASFLGLAPGRYRFRVAACNDDGVWNESEDRLEFVVPPVFPETIWFKLLCGAAAVLALVGVCSWRIGRLRTTQKLELEAEKRERTRIAQELHDTFLQGFTAVALKLDVLTNSLPASLNATREQFQKALLLIDQYLIEGRHSVWKLRSPTLESVEDFSMAIEKASERALNGTPIALSVSVQGQPRKLKELFEDNLLRICEEAVANSVKHARPTQIEVSLRFNSDEVQLGIRDNGCGFDTKQTKRGHFGLVGIRERVKSMGGNLSLNSQPGAGTEITVTVCAK
jgi:signal transduction histidine kinase/ligand-binding sensor domain-containing protein